MDPRARIGTTLKGKWRIDRLLGTGGFASVYAATHRAGKRVAIKVLHAALGASEEVRRRFLKEAYAANAVDHPAVVGVSDDDVTEDGAPFLVMDLLEGETAEARRKKAGGKLDVGEVLLLAEEVLDALAAAHAKGIVHRDLKPENLFVTADGHARVLDFGIARFREPGDESTATQTGLTMGSPAFMAPEQARGRWSEVDARTDVYAMGATMFVLLSGRLVHGKQTMNEALINAATRPAPSITEALPGVPPAVAAVVDRALAFEKERRWLDAGAMRDAVRFARGTLAGSTGTLPLGAAAAVTAAPTASPRPASGGETTFAAAADPPALATAAGPRTFAEPAVATAPLPQLQPSPRTTEIAPAASLPGSPSSPSTTSSPVVATHPPAKRAPAVIAPIAAVAGVLAIGIGVALLWSRSGAPSDPEASAAPPAAVPLSPTGRGVAPSTAPAEAPATGPSTGTEAAPSAAPSEVSTATGAPPQPPSTATAGAPATPSAAKSTSVPAAKTVAAPANSGTPAKAPASPPASPPVKSSPIDLRNTRKRK